MFILEGNQRMTFCHCTVIHVQQDPRPSQGGYLRTRDFLQQLEGVGKNSAKEENPVGITALEKLPSPAAPPPFESFAHILPTIGALRLVLELTSSSSDYRKKQCSSSNHHNSFSCFSSSRPKSWEFDRPSTRKRTREEEEDNEGEFDLKKESSYNKGDLTVKVDGNSIDQKANTPPPKYYSAMERHRRSKYNGSFQILRELVPHGRQHRDRASLVLEEKVRKYEGSY